MITLTEDPIDIAAVLDAVRSPRAGAVVLFLGTARQITGDRRTTFLRYECYPDMARRELEGLSHQALQRWPLAGSAIAHRFGRLEPGDVSVAIAVSAPHRAEAFQAGQWLIDRLKQVVPIWKEEHWDDGTCQWVHPGMDLPGQTAGGENG